MKLHELLRHIADNEENGKDWYEGLRFNPNGGPNWEDVVDNPDLFSLKPKNHAVNGFEVPVPMSEKPKNGEEYYCASCDGEEYYIGYSWENDSADKRFFSRGLCFSTLEAAAANAKAMIGIDPNT